jgi:cysteinyl-tRNA synthetase
MSLRALADEKRQRFDAAIASRNVDDAASAVLDLEQQVRDWQADTQQGDDDVARRYLRAMIGTLSTIAQTGAADPRERVAPFVELLIEIRGTARAAKDFATSDLVRDRLAATGIEVRDTPDGVVWSLRDES